MEVLGQDHSGANLIGAYGDRGFRIGEDWHHHALIVSATHLSLWEEAAKDTELTVEAFAFLDDLADKPEMLIYGGGASFPLPNRALITGVKARYGVTFDMMDTIAACRTYNVLISENRPVLAAMLLPEM